MSAGRIWAVALALCLVGGGVSAQTTTSRLASRFDSATYSRLRVLIDSARAAKLPVRLIEDNALEGASSGASGDTILAAVRQFTGQLAVAQAALGVRTPDSELRAAVSAIDAGIPAGDLKRMRRAAPKRSIATALMVVGDVAGRHVPPPTASDLLVSLLSHNVKDRDLLTFARWVRQDIEKGADPTTAARARASALILAAGRGAR